MLSKNYLALMEAEPSPAIETPTVCMNAQRDAIALLPANQQRGHFQQGSHKLVCAVRVADNVSALRDMGVNVDQMHTPD